MTRLLPFSNQGVITPLPTIESSYAVFTAKGLDSYTHPDNAALVVCIAWLNAMESILWRFIRGSGLAYGASIRSDVESSHIHFSLYRSPDSSKAFLEAKKVIEKLCRGEMEVDETTIESAKSSLHYSIADSEGTVGSAAGESFVDEVVKKVGKGRGRKLLEETSVSRWWEIGRFLDQSANQTSFPLFFLSSSLSKTQRVDLSEVKRVLKTYILPLFDSSSSVCAIVSTPSRVEEIQKALEKEGYEMEKKELDLGAEDSEMEDGSGSESGSGSGSGSESESESEEEGKGKL